MGGDYPTLAILMKMSEPQRLTDEDTATLLALGPRFVTGTELGYVVIDRRFVSDQSAALVVDAWDLEEVQRVQHLTLYRPAAP